MHEKQETTESRKAHNEALFRDANESVRSVQEELGGDQVEQHAGYCIVEKSGLSAEIAEATDPRKEE
jgi:hypothetical protein